MKILILDDDKDLLTAVRLMLIQHDHEVDCSDNAEQAVDMVTDGDYDFVLVDYKMPENDGIWFMKNVDRPKKTKALLVTAFVNREVINRMFALGACGYLIKPFNEEEIIRHLDFFSNA